MRSLLYRSIYIIDSPLEANLYPNGKHDSMSHSQEPTPLDRRGQCTSVELLVGHIDIGPQVNGQPKPSALVVGGPKSYNIIIHNNHKINVRHEPTLKTMITDELWGYAHDTHISFIAEFNMT